MEVTKVIRINESSHICTFCPIYAVHRLFLMLAGFLVSAIAPVLKA